MPKSPEPAATSESLIARILAAIPQGPGYLLALSGGGDSAALLKILAGRVELRCAHINHGLGPQAPEMQTAAERMALRYHCDLETRTLPTPPASNLENWAREQRYAALAALLQPGEILLTAHHRDDQAETFLLAAARASGPAGLRAMVELQPFGVGWLARPALGISRDELQSVLDPAVDVWVSDIGNSDARFDRNRLRHDVMPVLAAWKAEAPANLARAATQWAQVQQHWAVMLNAYAEEISGGIPHAWRAEALLHLPDDVRGMFLRRMTDQAGAPPPPAGVLRQLPEQLRNARDDASVCLQWLGWSLRLYRKRLFLLPPLPALPVTSQSLSAQSHVDVPWSAGGQVRVTCASEEPTVIAGGQTGAVLSLNNGQHKPLSKLFQEMGVPVWVRSYWPQMLRAGEVVAVAEIESSWPADVSNFRWLQAPGWVQPWLDRARARAFR